MKNNRYLKAIFLLVCLVLFIAFNLIYIYREIRLAFEAPNVTVKLNAPIFGVYGITGTAEDQLNWKKIESGSAFARFNGRLYLESECQAYVSIDETEIRDASVDEQYILSSEELSSILIDVCEANYESSDLQFEIEDLSNYVSNGVFYLPRIIKVYVSGRYNGYITLYSGHPSVPVKETNLNQVWNASEHFPYRTVLTCLIISAILCAILFIIGNLIMRRMKTPKVFVFVMTVPAIILFVYILYLVSVGYFAPI